MSEESNLWNEIVELTRTAVQNESDPLSWTIQLSSELCSAGVSLPSSELAHLLVSHICWGNNVPIMWKFLEKALAARMVPSVVVISLLSARVIPNRQSKPSAYRLYMEVLKRYGFEFKYLMDSLSCQRVMKWIDCVLDLSLLYGIQENEPGVVMTLFFFTILSKLLDATLEDEGLVKRAEENEYRLATLYQDKLDTSERYHQGRNEDNETLQNINTLMAMEMTDLFLRNETVSLFLSLVRQNMPSHWVDFAQRLNLLKVNTFTLRSSRAVSFEFLMKLHSKAFLTLPEIPKRDTFKCFNVPMAFGSCFHSSGLCHMITRSAHMLPLDLVLEDAMDGSLITPTNAVETITDMMKALQSMSSTTWHDTFLGLWVAALCFVQRERDPMEGPVPHLDTRLCLLLSISILAVVDLIAEDENELAREAQSTITNSWKQKKNVGRCKMDFISSLRMMGDFKYLLSPPQSVVREANQAAAKALFHVSSISFENEFFEGIDFKGGNLWHLIVEACIARDLLDTSAYLWPGYINAEINKIPIVLTSQTTMWSSFMHGSILTPEMVNPLASTPATSLAALEKLYEIAVRGSEEEKISAATILCGASLIRGWNVQEHAADFVVKLLSPPVDVKDAPMLNIVIVGIASVDCVQIFSLHGLIPHLACALMPICEVFGSCMPTQSWTLRTGDEISAHTVFCNAFILLLKLWRFNHPPLEHGGGDIPPVGSHLTPEYLLLIRNSHVESCGRFQNERNKRRLEAVAVSCSPKPIFVDSFPKLKSWYRQHQACIASTASGLVPGTLVHRTVDGLLGMMFRKMEDDTTFTPELPAWDLLEAIPFVVDAALTACAHGKLSPRQLATGLKDLADFLPASLATIVSYFSAEVTRGVWKPAFMNGTDWPSPAANLSNVEEQIKKILAATGVDVPSLANCTGGNTQATLPLPLAAFVSVTITYKIDRASERFLNVAGPALEALAAGCPWPSMPIVASLWTQKAKRWSDFLVFSASRTVFLQSKDAVVQLLRSCFAATLGLKAEGQSFSAVDALLGRGFGSHFGSGFSAVAPGILYLRAYRSIRDISFIVEEILSLMMDSVREISSRGVLSKARNGSRRGEASIPVAMSRAHLAASLAAFLVWSAGGSSMVQSLMIEILPSWLASVQKVYDGMASMLGGCALAYFAVLSSAFAWGVGSSASASKHLPVVLGRHMEFIARAVNGEVSIGCGESICRWYVLTFVSLIVSRTPEWVMCVDASLVQRLSSGLSRWRKDELAFALLRLGGLRTMGSAAQYVIQKYS